MVGITVSKNGLLSRLKRKISAEALLEALPETKANPEREDGDDLTLEVQPDRPDLLSVQGVARALNGFLGFEKGIPVLNLQESKEKVIVDKSVARVRPVFVCALVEGVKITEEDLKSLIQSQEKLTLTHGRRRRKVAIGVHDADYVVFPVTYKTVPRDSTLKFIPLTGKEQMTPAEVLTKLPKGLEYGWILKDAKEFPIIVDANDQVVSFPPIINASKTTVTTKTKRLFLDVTGTDFEACNAALAILCQDLAADGAKVYSMKVNGKTTPELEPEKMVLEVSKAKGLLGVDWPDAKLVECLQKQRLDASVKSGKIEVSIPRYRSDFLHPIDLVEEIAIGFGYNKFEPKAPSLFTVGRLSGETLSDERVANTLVGAGFVEEWTYVISSSKKHPDGIKIKNPVSSDYDSLRSNLKSSLLDTLASNQHESYPQKVFEIGEVVVKDAKHHLRSITQKRVGAFSAHANASLSEIASVMALLFKARGESFVLEQKDEADFIPGRCAIVKVNGKRVGVVGEVHPETLEKLQVYVPVAMFELTL